MNRALDAPLLATWGLPCDACYSSQLTKREGNALTVSCPELGETEAVSGNASRLSALAAKVL